MKSIYDKHACVFGHSLLPIFNLVRPLHIINVHTDLVVDFGRQLCTVARINIRKDDPGPESLVVQKPHGLIDQPLLICYWLQFVEVHTLRKEMPELWYILFWPVHNSICSIFLKGKMSVCTHYMIAVKIQAVSGSLGQLR